MVRSSSTEPPEHGAADDADDNARDDRKIERSAVALEHDVDGEPPKPMRDKIGHMIPTMRITEPSPIRNRCTSMAFSAASMANGLIPLGRKPNTHPRGCRDRKGRIAALDLNRVFGVIANNIYKSHHEIAASCRIQFRPQ